MQIRGTQKLGKKTLDLYSVKVQIQSSKMLPINDSDFYNSDVQIAHKMGLIEVVGDVPAINTGLLAEERIEDTEERMIKCKNIHTRSIGINCLEMSVAPGEEFHVSESNLNTADMRAAVGKKMIQVIEASGHSPDFEEANVKLDQLLKKEKPAVDKTSDAQKSLVEAMQRKKERLETNEEIKHVVKEETKEKIKWNPSKKKTIEAKESSLQDAIRTTSSDSQSISGKRKEQPVIKTIETAPLNVIDTSNPAPVKTRDVDDPRKGMVVVNQKGRPVIKESMTKEEVNDLIFSDKEEEEKRIEKHPILGKKAKKNQNEEIDFIG